MAHFPHGYSAGLIVGSTTIWRWQYQLIHSLIESGLIDVREIIVLELPEFKLSKSISLLHRLDGKIFNSVINAFELVDVSLISGNVCSVESIATNEFDLDVMINLSEAATPDELLEMAKLATLTPLFSQEGELRSAKLGINEYIDSETQVCLSVSAQNKSGEKEIIAQAFHSLDSGSFSRNLNQYWIWMTYLWQQALDSFVKNDALASSKVKSLGMKPEAGDVSVGTNHRSNALGQSTKSLFQLSKHIKQKLQQKYLHTEQWVLLLKHFNKDLSGSDELIKFSEYQELSPPEDCFWADPFVVSEEGKNYVFFEELPFATERGHLSCMEVFADGSHSDPVVIVREDYHLSYPNVFEYDSTYYMIPESGDNGTIDLYRCTVFPYQWEHHKTLINNIHAYDSTLVEYDGRWWLFATVVPELGLSGCETLHVFHADSPVSTDWQPHGNNPVISNPGSARPGGNFYINDNQLYRVSQDCAGQYGAGVNVNKVTQLSTLDYEEDVMHRYYPDWDDDLIALHTLNFNENIAASDALRVKAKGLF